VLARFPYTDGTGDKIRPGVVVQCDANNRRLNAVILAFVTSNTRRSAAEPTQALIEIATSDGAQSGLLHDSVVKCDHLITVHKQFLKDTVGRLTPNLMGKVDACLKTALELS